MPKVIAPDAMPVPAPHANTALLWLSELHERQRQDVAAALHNQIGQAVSAIKMSAHLVLDETDPAQRREDLLEIIRIADDAVAHLRTLHCQLRPPQLDSLGLEAALRGEVERLASVASDVHLDLSALPFRPQPAVELACLRIAQALLSPRAGPAGAHASRIRVALQDQGQWLSLLLQVDADGPHTGAGMTSLELAPLAAYAEALGGSLDALKADGACAAFELRLPFIAAVSTTSGHAVAPGSGHHRA